MGEPITAETSALVEVPGISSFINSGSTLLPRNCGGGISQPQADRSRQATAAGERAARTVTKATRREIRSPVSLIGGRCYLYPACQRPLPAVSMSIMRSKGWPFPSPGAAKLGRAGFPTLRRGRQLRPAILLYATLRLPDTLDGRFDAIVPACPT